MRIATHTLGCKLNYAETSNIVRGFVEAGATVVDYHEVADLYVVNTCTVTAIAEKKCRTIIRQAHRQNPDAIIAVVGCFAQNEAQNIANIEGVNIVLGNHDKQRLQSIVESRVWESDSKRQYVSSGFDPKSFDLSFSSGDRTRTFFKIQDGCDYFCTYCAIPIARGRSRSATIDETIAAAHRIAATGAKEVVLTGINTGTFGKAHGETFFDLIKALDKVEGILRYRISSIEPNLITDEIIDFVAQSRTFLPHFHIPLQAGNDKVLRLMHRRYDTALYADKLRYIKQVMPHACIAADIIAGFNGEGQQEFDEACRFVESVPISYLHIFTYSERSNTAALRMTEKVPMHERRERSRILHELSERKKEAFYAEHIGETRPVLWESDNCEGMMMGFTDNYIRLRQAYDPTLVNTITQAAITPENIVHSYEE
ncbi:MAG: tRNA (N(6)-L-threonylcarbamoyladenosine(37)-C(2))-methylthiotransferase MtaB [Bacteroidales bacterium]|nr:tRNA (N(6)-L-threonylcarbamoyladenosine(37)-C(2))-methylthiotransferase MtaB [Bacteroidales bacterium]